MQDILPICAVIMAGGMGRRMGGEKPSRMLGGQSLIERSIGKARQYTLHIAIAANRDTAGLLPGGYPILFDEMDGAGPISGLRSALAYAKTLGVEYALILPCDTPFLPADLAHRLYEAIGGGDAGAVLAHCDGRIHPACGLWRASALDHLPAYLAKGRASLHGFADAVGYTKADWPVHPIDPFFNINTAEDLAAAGDMLRQDDAG
jgi:molybdenum cofactor guanylyltransferase